MCVKAFFSINVALITETVMVEWVLKTKYLSIFLFNYKKTGDITCKAVTLSMIVCALFLFNYKKTGDIVCKAVISSMILCTQR